jgi:hypothetical protein
MMWVVQSNVPPHLGPFDGAILPHSTAIDNLSTLRCSLPPIGSIWR